MQLLDEETLLVGRYPPGRADGPQIEANLRYLRDSIATTFGTAFRVVRIPMPAWEGRYPDSGRSPYLTYTNVVFINRTVLVPVYGLRTDSAALSILRHNLPGYRVIGIDCRQVIGAGGALHCITRTIGTREPLRILHQQLRSDEATGFPTEVSAFIDHPSGIARAQVHYRLMGDSAFTPVPMIPLDRAGRHWFGYIPALMGPGKVHYYIEAEARDGKRMTRPMTAPQGCWRYELKPMAHISLSEG